MLKRFYIVVQVFLLCSDYFSDIFSSFKMTTLFLGLKDFVCICSEQFSRSFPVLIAVACNCWVSF